MFLAYMPPSVLDGRLRTRQGKVAELRLELNSGGKKDKNYAGKKIALKKIVANMTMSNNDMVALFPDIIGCMHLQSLEIKKMQVLAGHPWKIFGRLTPGQVLLVPCQLRQDETRRCCQGNPGARIGMTLGPRLRMSADTT